MSPEQLRSIVSRFDGSELDSVLSMLQTGGMHIGKLSEELQIQALRAVLNYSHIAFHPGVAASHIYFAPVSFLQPALWGRVMTSVPFSRVILAEMPDKFISGTVEHGERLHDVMATLGSIRHADMIHDLGPWRSIVDSMQTSFGPTWSQIGIAAISAGVKSRSDRGAGARNLIDGDHSLPDRIRYAKRQARHSGWCDQANSLDNSFDRGIWLISALAWCTPKTLVELIGTCSEIVAQLSDEEFGAAFAVNTALLSSGLCSRAPLHIAGPAVPKLDPRILALLLPRVPKYNSTRLATRHLQTPGNLPIIDSFFLDHLAEQVVSGNAAASSLEVISNAIDRGVMSITDDSYTQYSLREQPKVARAIFKNYWHMPSSLLQSAYWAIDEPLRARPVMDIAEERSWFTN
jgi:hypothetical protein